jgi:hypothetical protein
MLHATLFAAALLGSAPVQSAQCWQVFHMGGGDELFVDLQGQTYVEYRMLKPETAPLATNPDRLRVMFSLLVEHDIATDEVLGSSIVAEAREPDSEKMVTMPVNGSSITASIFDARLFSSGDTLKLVEDARLAYTQGVVEPVSGRAIYDAAIAGKTISMRYQVKGDGKLLDAKRDGIFRPAPEYQAAIRAKAREMAELQRTSGKCPLERQDN